MALPAIVAVTVHEPVPAVIDTEPDEFTVHAVEDPSLHVTVPLVVPPLVDSAMVAPYSPLAEPVIVNVDCAAFAAEMVTDADVAS